MEELADQLAAEASLYFSSIMIRLPIERSDSVSIASEEPPSEHTSLLPKPLDEENCNDQCENREDDGVPQSRLILTEFWILLKGSMPVILAYTLQNSLQTVSVLVVGRTSPENLATSAFSFMFAMITAWMIALGGTTAVDTLASSSFTGSSNAHDLGILLQRGFFVLGLLYFPVAILWACSEPVFLFLGQDPALSRDSARFLTCLVPGGLGYIFFELMKKYLQAQGMSCNHNFLFALLTISRNHATRDVCALAHVANQRSSELFLLLYPPDRTARGSSGNQYLILAFLLFACPVCTVYCRLRVLGRMVPRGFSEPGYFCPIGDSWNCARWERMVGL